MLFCQQQHNYHRYLFVLQTILESSIPYMQTGTNIWIFKYICIILLQIFYPITTFVLFFCMNIFRYSFVTYFLYNEHSFVLEQSFVSDILDTNICGNSIPALFWEKSHQWQHIKYLESLIPCDRIKYCIELLNFCKYL